ncbi:MAG: AAA family ATPase [Bacteroidota bacterium]
MKVISFVNMKGGVGKTTMAVNVSDCLSREYNKKVLTLNIDPQFSATQCIFPVEKFSDFMDSELVDTTINIFDRNPRIVVNSVSGAKTLKNRPLEEIKPQEITKKWHALPTNLYLYEVELRPGDGLEFRLRDYVDELRKTNKYDYVIIDTPPTPSVWMKSALIASDYYLVPIKPEPLSVFGLDLLEIVIHNYREKYNLPIKCIGMVVNMYDKRSSLSKETLSSYEKDSRWSNLFFIHRIPTRTKIARNQQLNKHIIDVNDNDSKNALREICDELIYRVKENERKRQKQTN